MQVSAIPSAERFKAQMSTAEAHEMLRSKTSVSSYIGSVNIFDADGQLVNSSDTLARAAHQHFGPKLFQDLQVRLARDGADRACPERLHRPLDHDRRSSAERTRWSVLGVIGRRIDPAAYEKFFASVALGNGAPSPCSTPTERCWRAFRMWKR